MREELTALKAQPATSFETFWFEGNGTQTTFALPTGWQPKQVFVDGALYRPGDNEDYTIQFDGFAHMVVLAVAPGNVDIGITAQAG